MDTDKFSIAPGAPEGKGPADALQLRESRVVVDPTQEIDFYRIHLELARRLETRGAADPVEGVLQGIVTLLGAETLCFEDRLSGPEPLRRWVHRHAGSPWAESMEVEAESCLAELDSEPRTRLHPCVFRERLFLLSAPLRVMGRQAGGVLVFLEAPSEAELQPFVAIFQASLGFLVSALLLGQLRGVEENVRDSAAWIELAGEALRAPYPERARQGLLDQVKSLLGCAHLVAGTVDGERPRVQGMAGLVQFERKGALISLLEQTLVETARAGEAGLFQAGDSDGTHQAMALAELARVLPGCSVRCLPLPHVEGDGESPARWYLIALWSSRDLPDRPQRLLAAIQPQLGGLLQAVEHSDALHLRKWSYLGWKRLEPHQKRLRKIAVLVLLLILALPVPVRISADARLEPALRRMVSARYEGTLLEALVRPGDLVEEGQVLARMDDVELLLREAEMRASLERAERRRDLALSDPATPVAAARMAQLEAEGLRLDLQLLQKRKEALELRAPMAGMVMAGDLDRAIGVPVQSGQTLFEIAQVDRMRVEMEVPAHEISRVKDGMPVRVRLQSYPGREWSSEVTRIAPRSDLSRGKNLFVVEAQIASRSPEESLRAGMVGRATMRGRRVPLFWALLRNLVDFVRVTLFW